MSLTLLKKIRKRRLEQRLEEESHVKSKVIPNIIDFAIDELSFHPDNTQKQILESQSDRIILNCTRQFGKSSISSIKALYKALYNPNQLILLISPSLRQSSELFKKVTSFFNSLKHKPRKIEDNRLSLQLVNGSRIVSLPSSEQTIRGFSSANLIIEDEASRVPDDLYYTIRPMLAVSKGQLILISTPFGKRGHFFKEWTDGINWKRFQVKATECERISKAFLEEEKKAIGEWWFKQEYGCEFTETLDSNFRYDILQEAISDKIKPLF